MAQKAMEYTQAEREFVQRFRECERQLLGYVLTMIPRHSDALDILQDTATTLWAKFENYDPERPFLPWARKFAHIHVCKFREKQRYRNWMLAPFDEHLCDVISEERQQHADVLELREGALRTCLESLEVDQKQLLQMRYWKQMTCRQLAESLDLSEDQLYRRLQAVRRILHECIDRRMADYGV